MSTPEIRTYEDLKQNITDTNLQNLIKEIDEIKDSIPNNDGLEGVFDASSSLQQELSNFLTAQESTTLQILIKEIGKIARDSSLKLNNETKNSLNQLLTSLLAISQQKFNEQNKILEKRQEASFNEFKKMIISQNSDGSNTINKLNSLSDKKMKDIICFIQNTNNKSKVFDLYYNMENIKEPKNYKRTDRKNYDNVLKTIKETYPSLKEGGTDEVKELQLNEMFRENLTANDLNEILINHSLENNFKWDGSNLRSGNLQFKKNDNEYFSYEGFLNKFNKYNSNRIQSVENNGDTIISKMDITGISYNEEKGEFKKNGDTIGLEELFNIKETDTQGFNILNIDELKQPHFKNIRKNWENNLKNRIHQVPDSNTSNSIENEGNGSFDNSIEKRGNRMNQERINKINEFTGDNAFLKIDGENLKYDINNVKSFLGTINQENFKNYFTKPGESSRYARLSATQLLLNHDYKNNLTIDGEYKRGGETYNAVLNFQKKYNNEHNNDEGFTKLKEDGIPGPKTLTQLLLDIENNNGNPDNGNNGQNIIDTLNQNPIIKIDDSIVNSLNLKENNGITTKLKASLNIPEGVAVYTTDNNRNTYYYKSGEIIVRVSTEEPRITKSTKLEGPSINISEWTSNVNVCEGGKNDLETKFKTEDLKNKIGEDNFNNLSIIISEGNPKEYQLKNGEIKISLSEDIFTKDFCGITDIKEKLNLIYLATELKLGKVQITYTETSGIEHPILSDSRKYDINLSNIDMHNFNDFYNKIK